ncbi:hypothetical protein [Pseudostreptobacillus hongkongensis]|uniref:hypothetical protein n=1 Tax=Pseudostreptobacillus hongkongensis TaxID=1162717 RepID=UPI00082FA35A|nr:hypothetical protein [Pseudostreptobacillus hongkongensis]
MAKYLTKEGLGNILNTVIGMKPKTLPARLEKNDIVLYQNRLYKYKGEPKQVNIVSESEFKKAGLRFMGEDYKVVLLNDILELYKWMYQSGLNGHKLENDWGERPNSYYITGNNKDTMWDGSKSVPVFDYIPDEHNLYFYRFKKMFNVTKFSDIFKFPIQIYGYKSMFLNNELEENEAIKNETSVHFYDNAFKKNKVNFEKPFFKGIEKEYKELYSKKGDRDFLKSENNDKYKYFKINSILPPSYEAYQYEFLKIDESKYIKIKEEAEYYNFGVYQWVKYLKYKLPSWEEIKNDVLETRSISYSDGTDNYGNTRYINRFGLTVHPITKPETFRFFLPYFIDAATNNTAKELNEKYNKYGVFVQGKEDGKYTLSFKVCMSTRDQHEEDVAGARNWGDMYAFSPTRNKVRQENETWVVWKKNDLISFELNWKVENGTAKDWKLKLLDENKRNTQGLDNFMKWIQVETFENYLFLQLFYGVYSVDDAGSWNEWQFAHILPPFNLEFKGE